MDFFAQQDKARRKTSLLVAYFGLAVVLTVLLVYIIPIASYYFWKVAPSTSMLWAIVDDTTAANATKNTEKLC